MQWDDVSKALRDVVEDATGGLPHHLEPSNQYVALRPAKGLQIAVHVHERFLAIKLGSTEAAALSADDPAFEIHKENGTTTYTWVRDSSLGDGPTRERTITAIHTAMERSSALGTFTPGDGPAGRRERPTGTCPVCFMRLPTTGRCDEHG